MVCDDMKKMGKHVCGSGSSGIREDVDFPLHLARVATAVTTMHIGEQCVRGNGCWLRRPTCVSSHRETTLSVTVTKSSNARRGTTVAHSPRREADRACSNATVLATQLAVICVVFGVYFVSCFDCVRLAKVDEKAFIEKAKDYVIFALDRKIIFFCGKANCEARSKGCF